MIPQEFDYTAPRTLKEALSLIESGERKILAGGMSLIPMMKLRLAAPEQVVDLGRIPELNGIRESGGVVHIGAMATHHDVESSPVVRAHCPLLGEAAGHIGDMQVRNRGTIGGSVAHADPAADYPAALLALEAKLRLVSARSERVVAAEEFFVDAFTTALEPGEIISEVQVPAQGVKEGYAYEKVPHPASGFAVVSVAVRVTKNGHNPSGVRIAVGGLGPKAFRDHAAEQAAAGGGIPSIGAGHEANSDLYASAAYRQHLARVHGARALKKALSRTS